MTKLQINQELTNINAHITDTEHEIAMLKSKLATLRDEKDDLVVKMANVDGLPILHLIAFENPDDEFEMTSEFYTDDPNDKRFEKYCFDYKQIKTGSISAGYNGCPSWGLYSMDENPLTIIEGKVKFMADADVRWGGSDSSSYESKIIENPTYALALMYFFKSMWATGDFHHCFLEGFEIEEVDGIKQVKFTTGS